MKSLDPLDWIFFFFSQTTKTNAETEVDAYV